MSERQVYNAVVRFEVYGIEADTVEEAKQQINDLLDKVSDTEALLEWNTSDWVLEETIDYNGTDYTGNLPKDEEN